MSIEVKVPVLPESVSDATIASWHKKAGDTVRRDENLLDLETDKVVLEVPSPVDGVLKEIRFKQGDTVTSQQVIAVIEEGKVAAAPTPAAPAATPAAAPSAAPTAAKAAPTEAAPKADTTLQVYDPELAASEPADNPIFEKVTVETPDVRLADVDETVVLGTDYLRGVDLTAPDPAPSTDSTPALPRRGSGWS